MKQFFRDKTAERETKGGGGRISDELYITMKMLHRRCLIGIFISSLLKYTATHNFLAENCSCEMDLNRGGG